MLSHGVARASNHIRLRVVIRDGSSREARPLCTRDGAPSLSAAAIADCAPSPTWKPWRAEQRGGAAFPGRTIP